MMLNQSSRHRAFAISAAAFCVLILASSKSIDGAAPAAAPDLPSIDVAPVPRSPEARSVDQQIKVAGDYLAGHGVTQDFKLAAYWYEKAAGAGDPLAELQIGYLYEAGLGVGQDPARAAHWYQLASAGGSVRAKASLAIAFLWGTGVPQNEKMALKLLNEAVASGSQAGSLLSRKLL